MPKGFEMCRKQGGKIRTKKLSGGRYQPICYLKGKMYKGEVHKKGETSDKEGYVAKAIKKRMGK